MGEIDLSQSIVLVTGGAIRLGLSFVDYFAKKNARIVVHYNRSKVEAEALSKQLFEQKVEHCLVQSDLSAPDAPKKLLSDLPNDFSDINILVNSAAVFPDTDAFGNSHQHWDEVIAVNARAPILLVEAISQLTGNPLRQVINILDARTLRNQSNRLVYRWSKHLLAQATKDLALQLAPNVRINGIALGAILPPQNAPNGHLARLIDAIALKCSGRPDHVTHALDFLLANEFVTGAIIPVDGGEFL